MLVCLRRRPPHVQVYLTIEPAVATFRASQRPPITQSHRVVDEQMSEYFEVRSNRVTVARIVYAVRLPHSVSMMPLWCTMSPARINSARHPDAPSAERVSSLDMGSTIPHIRNTHSWSRPQTRSGKKDRELKPMLPVDFRSSGATVDISELRFYLRQARDISAIYSHLSKTEPAVEPEVSVTLSCCSLTQSIDCNAR